MSLFGDICCLFSCSPRCGGNIPPENAGVRLSPVGVILPPVLLQCTLCPTYGLTRILYHNIDIIYITPH